MISVLRDSWPHPGWRCNPVGSWRFAITFSVKAVRWKPLLLGLISLVCLAAVLIHTDMSDVATAFATVSPATILLTAGLLAASNFLAYLRYGAILACFDFRPAKSRLFFSFAIGQIGNYFLFNILGQSVTRAMTLKRAGVPFGASLTATYVERLLALGLLFLLSAISLPFLFDELPFEVHRGVPYLLTVATAMIVTAIAVAFAVLRHATSGGEFQRGLRFVARLWPSALLTLLSHIAMLGAYLAFLRDLYPGSLSLEAAAALTIVMFVTSLPISFSGWGVRELSAAAALGYLGLPASTGVATGIGVGLLGVIVMFAFAGFGVLVKRQAAAAPIPQDTATAVQSSWWDDMVIKGCALFCAVFVFFQVRLPLANDVAVSAADPAALTGLVLIVLLVATKRRSLPLPAFLLVTLSGITVLLAGGLASAYFQDGIGQWALINRGLGWIVIVGYAVVGATAVSIAGETMRGLILRCAIVSTITICLVQFALMAFSIGVERLSDEIYSFPLEGFVNNPTGFSFQLASVGLLVVIAASLGVLRKAMIVATLSLLTVTLFYTKSRIGLVYLPVVFIWTYLAIRHDRIADRQTIRRLRFAGLAVIAILAFCVALPYATASLSTVLGHGNFGDLLAESTRVRSMGLRLSALDSENDRWMILQQAWAMFREHPVFGAGLGAYMEQNLAAGLKLQVIHSVPLWLLAETGLMGAGFAAFLVVLLLRATWRMYQKRETAPLGWGLIGLVLLMLIGGLVHDFLYQRIFWFLFGVLAAMPLGAQAPDRHRPA